MKHIIYKNWTILESDTKVINATRKANVTNLNDYQRDLLDKAMGSCRRKRNSIDIGANYGFMSYNMSKVFEKVYAFEIVPQMITCLEKNMKNMQCNNVEVFPYGAGEANRKVGLVWDERNSFSTHVDNDAKPVTEIRTIDSFNFSNIDFIKIDAEGYENLIIKGAMQTIKEYKPVILYENKHHGLRYGYDNQAVLNRLQHLGYEEIHVGSSSKNKIIAVS